MYKKLHGKAYNKNKIENRKASHKWKLRSLWTNYIYLLKIYLLKFNKNRNKYLLLFYSLLLEKAKKLKTYLCTKNGWNIKFVVWASISGFWIESSWLDRLVDDVITLWRNSPFPPPCPLCPGWSCPGCAPPTLPLCWKIIDK